MRNFRKRILSMFMAVLMVLGLTGNVVSAQPKGTVPQKSVADDQNYKPNEAIVMAYVDDSAKSTDSERVFQMTRKNGEFEKSKLSLAGDTVTIEHTYEFGTNETESKKLNSANSTPAQKTQKKLQISCITSEKLSTEALIKVIKDKYTNVVAVEPNYIVKASNLDYKDYQWALDNQGQNKGTAGKDINPKRAMEAANSDEQVVAIIDSGIDYQHEALQGNMWVNKTSVLEGTYGYDFCNGDDDPKDDIGHGTHCAGIIAGNGTGITGVAKNVKLMALKFLDSSGFGSNGDAIAAYDYINRAMQYGVNVVAINCSWGGSAEDSDILENVVNAVGEKGAITVTAAGNSFDDSDQVPDFPWAFTSDYKINVAACDEKGELARFSNYGANNVDIAAPGTDILSSVCYNVYNPTIHSGAEQSSYSEIYNDFSGNELPAGHKEFNLDITKKAFIAAPTLSIDAENSFGTSEDTSGSLKLEVDIKGENIFGCYWPITLPASETYYYCSAMVKNTYIPIPGETGSSEIVYGVAPVSTLDEIFANPGDAQYVYGETNAIGICDATSKCDFWNSLSGNAQTRSSSDGAYAFFVLGNCSGSGSYKLNMDNIGFSRKDMEPFSFGKYDFYNGTSIAAPYVTGSVALMKQCYPELSTKDLRDKVATCGRVEEKLAGCTRDGRNLDLSYYDKDVFSIQSFSYENGKVKVAGSGLSEVQTINVDGNSASITGQKENELYITTGNCANKTVRFDITLKDNTNITRTEYMSYNTVDVEDVMTMEDIEGGAMVSDGSTLYSYGEGFFWACNVVGDSKEWNFNPVIDNGCIDPDIQVGLPNEAAKLKSNLFYDNHKIYALAQSSINYYSPCAVVVYDTVNGEWSKLCDLPNTMQMANIVGSSLAVYNGKLYLMGGMDEKTLQVKNTVNAYDLSEETWSTQSNLPENRAFANVNVVKGKLLLTFGTVDGQASQENVAPAPLILTEDEWSKSGAVCKAAVNREVETETNQYSYYDVPAGDCTKGLIFTGLVSEDYGDVFYYNADSDTYEAYQDCSLYPYSKDSAFYGGTSVADQFYFIGLGEHMIKENEYGIAYFGFSTELYSIPLDTGYWRVSGDEENCRYEGTGYYLPGDTAKISIIPDEGYLVEGYYLNGEKHEGSTVTIDAVNKEYTIEPITIPFADKIVFLKDNHEVVAGKNLAIGIKLLPVGAKDEITWSVNSNYSSIKNGVLKTSIKDAGRELTVTVQTESGVKNSCKVKVLSTALTITLNKKQVVLKQGESFKLQASVSPKEAVNAQVCYTTSNPAIAMVNNSGDLVGLKPGKVIVTIFTAAVANVTPVKVQCQVTVVAPVNNVAKLKAKATTNHITLNWNAVKSADGYVVYRYDSKTKKDVKLATIKGGTKTSYTVKRLLGSKGSKLTAGTAYVFKVTAYDAVEGTVFYGSKASISTCTTPYASSIKGLTNSKKGELKVTYEKASGVNGYKIYVCNKSGGTYQLKGTIKKAGTYKTTLKSMKKGTWYVKVRTYKVINGKTVYSSYSVAKKIKIKK